MAAGSSTPTANPSIDDATHQATLARIAQLEAQLAAQQAVNTTTADGASYTNHIPVGKVRKAIAEGKINFKASRETKSGEYREWRQKLAAIGNEFPLFAAFLSDSKNETDSPDLDPIQDGYFLACLKFATSGYAHEKLCEGEEQHNQSGRACLRGLEKHCCPKTYGHRLHLGVALAHKLPVAIPSKSSPAEALTQYARALAEHKRLYGDEILNVQIVSTVISSLPSCYAELKLKLLDQPYDTELSLEDLIDRVNGHFTSIINPSTNGALSSNTEQDARLVAMATAAGPGAGGHAQRGWQLNGQHRHHDNRGGHVHPRGNGGAHPRARNANRNNSLRTAQVRQNAREREVKSELSKTCYICKKVGHIAPMCPDKGKARPALKPNALVASYNETPTELRTLVAVASDTAHPSRQCSDWHLVANRHLWPPWYVDYQHSYAEEQQALYAQYLGIQLPLQCCQRACIHARTCEHAYKHLRGTLGAPCPPVRAVAAIAIATATAEHRAVAPEEGDAVVPVYVPTQEPYAGNGAEVLWTNPRNAHPHAGECNVAEHAVIMMQQRQFGELNARCALQEAALQATKTEMAEHQSANGVLVAQMARELRGKTAAVAERVSVLESQRTSGASRRGASAAARAPAVTPPVQPPPPAPIPMFDSVEHDSLADEMAGDIDESDNLEDVPPGMGAAPTAPRRKPIGNGRAAALDRKRRLDDDELLSSGAPTDDYDAAITSREHPILRDRALWDFWLKWHLQDLERCFARAPCAGKPETIISPIAIKKLIAIEQNPGIAIKKLIAIENGIGLSPVSPDDDGIRPPSCSLNSYQKTAIENPKKVLFNGKLKPRYYDIGYGWFPRGARQSLNNSRRTCTAGQIVADSPIPSWRTGVLPVRRSWSGPMVTPAVPGLSTLVACAAPPAPAPVGATRVPTVLDSGANACMFRDPSWFTTLDVSKKTDWTVADSDVRLTSSGVGTVLYPVVDSVTGGTVVLTLPNSYYCPTAAYNLISVSVLEDLHQLYCDFANRVAATPDSQMMVRIERLDGETRGMYCLREPA
jgi:hypothetical protein